jgi:phosphoserine phosphatase
MSAKTQDSSYIATAVAPNTVAVEALEGALKRVLEGAGLALSGPTRILSTQGKWSALEIPVNTVAEALPKRRKALSEAWRNSGPKLADMSLLATDQRKKKLLVSDMDSTIIQQECLDELAAYAGLKDEIAAITARAMAGELDFEAALTERVGKLDGLSLSALQQCYDERITLMPGAKTLTATMAAHSAFCLLVSGGFTFFTSRVAAEAGFNAHKGNTLIDDGNALTGEVGRPILGREAKLEALDDCAFANGITRADTLAMGDGANDLAMIEAAGLGLAVHAKPIVAEAADAAINVTDLTAALYFQGYTDDEIVWRD